VSTELETEPNIAQNSQDLVEIFGANSPIGIYVVQGGLLQYVNHQFQMLSGYTHDELIRIEPLKLVFPEDRKRVLQNASEMLDGKLTSPYAYRFVRKDSTVGWVTETVTRIKYRGKRAILGYFMDTTALKQLEHELRRSQEKLQRIFDCAPDGITVNDFDGTVTEVNERMVELHSYNSKEEVIGRSAYEFVAPEEHQKMKGNLRETLNNGVSRGVEYNFLKVDGSRFPVELASSVLRDVDGKPIGFIAVTRDITQRKLDEEALRLSQEFSSSLLRNSPNPIVVINPDASIEYVNPAFENMTGFTSAEIVGAKPPYPWWPREHRRKVRDHFNRELHYGSKGNEMLLRRKNGEQFWVKTTSVVVKDNGKIRYCLSNWIDITEQRRLRENVQFYVTQIIRAQEEERKRIARELHDDTAQTLTGVCMDIDDVISTVDGLPEIAIDRLQRLRVKIDCTLEEVRRFSHELRPVLLDRFGLVPSIRLLIEEMAEQGGFAYSFDVVGCEKRLTPEVELTLFRITQEALHNIRKHARASDVVVKITFTNRKMKMRIYDNGCGFASPNALGDLGRAGKLGLLGMTERARLLNGNVNIRSRLGKGTIITVEVPISIRSPHWG